MMSPSTNSPIRPKTKEARVDSTARPSGMRSVPASGIQVPSSVCLRKEAMLEAARIGIAYPTYRSEMRVRSVAI